MAQTFNVVMCFNCTTYQVDIHKKSTNKWSCKMCGTKQSLKQVFYQGDSKECRLRVKALNEMKGQREEEKGQIKLNAYESQFEQQSFMDNSPNSNINHQFNSNSNSSFSNTNSKPRVNKWAKYLTKEDLDNEDNYSDNENY